MEEFVRLLQQAMAEELRAQRLYTAMLVLAPDDGAKAKLLELFADEVDHSAILEDMTMHYTTGAPGTVVEQLGGVK